MPELPEVECVRQGLQTSLTGQTIRSIRLDAPDLLDQNSLPLSKLRGQVFCAFERRGKTMRLRTQALDWYLHLGMTGVYMVESVTPHKTDKTKTDHIHLRLETFGGTRLHYRDPRRFGWMCLVKAGQPQERWERLGPDALGNDWHATKLWSDMQGRIAPIKSLLLDQTLVAGLGNIYVCEALFAAGVSPKRPGGQVTKRECGAIVRHAKRIMNASLRNRGTTISDYRLTNGRGGAFQMFLKVFQKEGEPCPKCSHPIQRLVQSARSSFYCSYCQR